MQPVCLSVLRWLLVPSRDRFPSSPAGVSVLTLSPSCPSGQAVSPNHSPSMLPQSLHFLFPCPNSSVLPLSSVPLHRTFPPSLACSVLAFGSVLLVLGDAHVCGSTNSLQVHHCGMLGPPLMLLAGA